MYFGEVGKRYELTLTLKKEYSFKTYFGYREQETYIYTMEDENGNVFVWKTTSIIGMDTTDKNGRWAFDGVYKNDTFKCKATVKEHSEYKGTEQTVLNRVKVLRIDHVPTKAELDFIKRQEQLASLKDGDKVKEMPYRQYKAYYSDCETVAGSYREATPEEYMHTNVFATIEVIIRDGRLKKSGVRGEHFHSYQIEVDGVYHFYRAVSEENAIKRARKDYPEAKTIKRR